VKDFHPFVTYIKDLNNGSINIGEIYQRPIIDPFDIFFKTQDIVKCNMYQVAKLLGGKGVLTK